MAKLGPKAFEQCAGFMRISGGDNPLDATSIHPESYEAAGKLLEELGWDTRVRGEALGLEEFAALTDKIAQKKANI